LASIRALVTAAPDQSAAILDVVRRQVRDAIARDGALRIRTRVGCFVCS
jgi:hypothetical protein